VGFELYFDGQTVRAETVKVDGCWRENYDEEEQRMVLSKGLGLRYK